MSGLLPVSRVVVHADGAVVERRGTVGVSGGRAIVGGLPASLDPESVRLSCADQAVGRLRGFHVGLELPGLPEPAPARDEEHKALEADLRRIEAEIAALQVERQAAVQLAPGWDPEGGLPTASRVAGWVQLEAAVGPWVERIDESLRQARKRREELAREVQALAGANDAAAEAAHWAGWVPTVGLTVEVEGDGPLELELSYRVEGARWSPAYVLDADGELSHGRIVMRALVAQATGESWEGVSLSLSSRSSLRATQLPTLLPFRMGAALPRPPAGWRALPGDFDTLFSMGTSEPEPEPMVAEVVVEEPAWNGTPPDDELIEEEDSWAVEGLIDEEQLAPGQENGVPGETTLPGGAAGQIHRPSGEGHEAHDPTSASIDLEDTNRPFAVPDVARATSADPGTQAGEDMQETHIEGLTDPAEVSGIDTEERQVMRAAPMVPSAEGLAPRGPTPAESPKAVRPPALVVEGALLDYPRLRLGSPQGTSGDRGRLFPIDEEGLLLEAEMPEGAIDRLHAWRAEQAGSHSDLAQRPLPRHHALPAPVEGREVTFQADGLVDLASDGQPRWVAVFSEALDLEVRYTAVPRNDLRAWRRVRAELPHGQPLPAGPFQVFVEGALEATLAWGGSGAHEAVELSLGPEERISVSRNVEYKEEKLDAPLGARKFYTKVVVEVASALPREVKVNLIERVPVPAEGNGPEVEIDTSTPIARPYLGEPGGPVLQGAKVQTLEVPAEGEARAVLRYAIGLGTGEQIEGGDRRG